MASNDEIIEKNERICKLWFGSLQKQYHKDLSILMDKARADGYKQGQKDATNRIFEGLQSHAYILIKPPKGATRKENVALDLTKAEFEYFKKQFEVD